MSPSPLTIDFQFLPHGEGLEIPRAQSAGAAGLDLRAALPDNAPLVLGPGEYGRVPCGFAMSLPVGFEGQVRPRSGLADKFGITVLNAPGTIDADYRGEIQVILINHGQSDFTIQRGARIAQLVVAPVQGVSFVQVETLELSVRGERGFGSTGHED